MKRCPKCKSIFNDALDRCPDCGIALQVYEKDVKEKIYIKKLIVL